RLSVFLFGAAATTAIYTLSLHDALPISRLRRDADRLRRRADLSERRPFLGHGAAAQDHHLLHCADRDSFADQGIRSRSEGASARSEEHTSELQSRENLVCRLLLEKKKKK